jgi:L-asparaginase II
VHGFVRGYVGAEHPLMREISAALEATTAWRLANAPRGTDGCSIPTFAIPLRHLALGFARFGSGTGLSDGRARAARRLREAVVKAPFYVAGTGRFDTRVMECLGARVFCKVGAEGVYCAAFPQLGLGVAIKMDDGNNARAVEVAVVALVEALLPLNDADHIRERLDHLIDFVLDAGACGIEPTTIVDLTGPDALLVRQGKGPVEALGL